MRRSHPGGCPLLAPLASAVCLVLSLARPASAFDEAPLLACVQPYYQGRASPETALPRCLEALRATPAPDRYWMTDKALAKWRIKAGRVVWLSLEALLDKGGKKPGEAEFSWFVDEMQKIAESRVMGKKYTSRAYIIVGSIKGLIAKYYRSGLGKKNVGKEAFHAIRAATLVDPFNPEYWNREAWFTYGHSLVEICTGPMTKMAAYVLDINPKTEVARTLEALGKIPPPGESRQKEHSQLERRLQDILKSM